VLLFALEFDENSTSNDWFSIRFMIIR